MAFLDEYNEDINSVAAILATGARLNQSNFGGLTTRLRRAVGGAANASWGDFRAAAVEVLWEKYGLQVTLGSGNGGTLNVTGLTVPQAVGEALARELLQGGALGQLNEPKADELLYERVDGLGELIGCAVDISLHSFREGFRGYRSGNDQLRFYPGPGWGFYLGRAEIAFDGNENAMTKLAVGHLDGRLRERWGGIETVAEALGGSLGFGSLQNVDAFVLGKQPFPDTDHLYLAAVEAKKRNRPTDLFGALRQAASYKSFANEVWIMAPGLSTEEYRDAAQHEQFLESCRDHGFGVMNVQLNDDCDDVIGVTPVLAPTPADVRMPTLLNDILAKVRWRRCALCARYYKTDGEDPEAVENTAVEQAPANCGWANDDGGCMRICLEGMALVAE